MSRSQQVMALSKEGMELDDAEDLAAADSAPASDNDDDPDIDLLPSITFGTVTVLPDEGS